MKAVLLIVAMSALLLGCSGPAAESPTGVLRQYVEASQKQDIATMKRLLSKGSLDLLERAAKDQGVSADELLKKETEVKIDKAPETRNEIIQGDMATVEVKNELNGQYDMKLPFVREDGAWKIARDKYIEELMRKSAAERHAPDAHLNDNANANTAPLNK